MVETDGAGAVVLNLTTGWSWVTNATLSDWGALASVGGLALTAVVLFSVRRIKAYYVVRKRIPELAKRLAQHSLSISESLNDFDAFKGQLAEELVQAVATLESIRNKLNRSERKQVKDVLAELRKVDLKDLDEPVVRTCYLGFLRIQEHLKNLEADMAWER